MATIILQRHRFWLLTIALLAIAVGLSACNFFPLAPQPTPTSTLVARLTPTATPTSQPTLSPTASPTPSTTATPSPSATPTGVPPTATPTATAIIPVVPQVAVLAAELNVRSGPGLVYPAITTVRNGTVLLAQARSLDSQWVLTCCVHGQQGWVRNRADLVWLNVPVTELPALWVPSPTPFPTPTPHPTRTPTPTPWPTSTPTSAPATGWLGQYYNNTDLAGSVILVRYDPVLRFNWGRGSPHPSIQADNFSVRWTQRLWFNGGQYRFYARSDDGVRLWVDGHLVIDAWRVGSATTYTGMRSLSSGSHDVRVEYFERTGEAQVDVWWQREESYPEWRGEYFSNRNLAGQPTLVRNDVQIGFDWGTGSPAVGIPADNFSARWTRRVYFPNSGVHRFNVRVDDGIRIWVDGQNILDAWRDGPPTEYVVDRVLSAGWHDLEVHYYERTGTALVQVFWRPLQPTATPTPTLRPTNTPTRRPTQTPTPVPPTATPTATATPTNTPTPVVPTATPTATAEPTNTPTPVGPTATPTATTEPTSTPTPVAPTATPTATTEPTNTPTPVAPTATPTATTEPTNTPTPVAPTATPTATTEPTNTPTPVVPTATPTATAEPTNTPTPVVPTATPTATAEPTNTPTPVVPTATPTATAEPTNTPTPVAPTATPTPPFIVIDTPVPTPVVDQPVVLPVVITPTVSWTGTPVTVTGTSWPAGSPVEISVLPGAVKPGLVGKPVARTRVQDDGTFVTTFALPPMNLPGSGTQAVVSIVAATTNSRYWGSALLTLQPGFELQKALPESQQDSEAWRRGGPRP